MKMIFAAATVLAVSALGLTAWAECSEKCENHCAAVSCSCESEEGGECKCSGCGEETALLEAP